MLTKVSGIRIFCSLVIAANVGGLNILQMATVKFTYALKKFFPNIGDIESKGKTLREILTDVESRHPKIKSYLLDDQGKLRDHVNIFIDGVLIRDRGNLSDQFLPESEIYIMQALSGG